MITTEGYRDILHIARHKKPLNFSNYQDLPWQRYPIVRRRYRLTVPERITKTARCSCRSTRSRPRRVLELKEAGVEAVAVCFLFSFLNPEHEARVAAIVREEFPEAFLSVSSEVLPQYREYERFSTVCLNAFIGPKVGELRPAPRGRAAGDGRQDRCAPDDFRERRRDGGGARSRPVNLLMSGPVAGVVGGIWAGRQAGYDNVITLDVGGTSADIGLAQEGRLRMKHLLDTRVGPYQAMIPMVDVDTIGAGGGSIAYVDQGGIFRVGPRSAGADPGPACLRPRRHRGDGDRRDGQPRLARPGGIPRRRHDASPRSGAHGVRAGPGEGAGHVGRGGVDGSGPDPDALDGPVDRGELGAQGLRSARLRARRRGRRGAALRRAGGARGRHAVGARPALPGHHLCDGPARDGHGLRVRLDRVPAALDARRRGAPAAVRGARGAGPRAARRGRRPGRPRSRPANRRLPVPRAGLRAPRRAPAGAIDDAWVEKVRSDFHDIHEREYSRRFEESDIELPNVRVRGIGLMPALATPEVEPGGESPEGRSDTRAPPGSARRGAREVATRYYDRAASRRGTASRGPAIVNQYDTTTVVPPGIAAHVDRFGNIVIEVGASAEARPSPRAWR